jgi:hypothetical protein
MMNAIFARHKSLNPIALIFLHRDQKVATRQRTRLLTAVAAAKSSAIALNTPSISIPS